MDPVAGKILGASVRAGYFLDNLRLNSSPLLILDILLVAILFYWVYVFLKETRAMRILYGLLFLLILMAAGRLLDLILLNWILQSLMTMLIVAIPVVFQPELRSALERLGRTKFLGESAFLRDEHLRVVNEIVFAATALSGHKRGALIVLQRQTGLREYIDNGKSVDARVSSDLIQSIFFPKSPLHDGAIIIVGDKITSASSILPVSQANLSSNLGTRHKAAVGITEISDALAVVVSEETGSISLAVAGRIDCRMNEEKLKNRLISLMRQNVKNK